MKKIINLKLYNNNELIKEYNNINSILKDNEYTMIIDNVKTVISPKTLRRETDEYRFDLNIESKKALYLLKMNNTSFDIDVEKIIYTDQKNNIILEYKLNSEEGHLKIIIEKGDSNE